MTINIALPVFNRGRKSAWFTSESVRKCGERTIRPEISVRVYRFCGIFIFLRVEMLDKSYSLPPPSPPPFRLIYVIDDNERRDTFIEMYRVITIFMRRGFVCFKLKSDCQRDCGFSIISKYVQELFTRRMFSGKYCFTDIL